MTDRRLLRRLLLGIVLVVGALYVGAYAFAGDRVPRGTTVAGVDVGGLRPAAAERALARGLAGRLDDPVSVVVGDRRFAVDPAEAGLDVDVAASVAQVPVGRSWNPADLWQSVVGGTDHDAVVTADEAALEAALQRLADRVEIPAVEGGVRFTRSRAVPTYPEPGQALDLAAAADAVRAAYPASGDEVTLETVAEQPEVSAAEVGRAMKQFADPAMSAPVVYRIGGESVVLQPRSYARALSMVATDGVLEPRVDRDRLLRAFEPAMTTVAEEPVDATVRIVGGRPEVVPAKKGVTIDLDRVVRTFPRLAAASGEGRELEMATAVAEPAFSTADARALGITEKVSEFTTYYPHADYRNTNIGRAAALVDGTLLKPGETFSLNDTVGERTRENGFTEGFIISNGVFAEELGGGVSQVATTTFNAAFFAGLEDVQHKPHSFYIDRYPVGREATVAWPTVDLRFRNDTGHGVLIQTVHTPSTPSRQGALTVRMWSTKVWDVTAQTSDRYAFTAPGTRQGSGDSCVPNTGFSGFQVDVTRVFRRPGDPEVVRRERFHTTYIPADTVVCAGP